MGSRPRYSGVVAFAALAIGAGVLLGLAGWPQPHRMLELCALILAAVLASALAMQPSITKDWATMPPSFVVDFTALLLLGPYAMALVAAVGMATQAITDSHRSHPLQRVLVNAVTPGPVAMACHTSSGVPGTSVSTVMERRPDGSF